MINKKILSHIPVNKAYGFDNLMLDLIRKSIRVNIAKHTGHWLDIGRPDDYLLAIEEFERLKGKLVK